MARYVIVGAGAVGAALAAQFESAGVQYILVGRGEHIERIAADGLRYGRHGTFTVVPLRTARGPQDVELTADDVLVFATKVQDLEDAVRQWSWQPVAGGRTSASLPVVVVQNGLDGERIALRRFSTVYGGSLMTPARFTVPGEIVVGAAGPVGVLTIGRYPTGSDDALETIAAELRTADYIVQISDDVVRWKAAKILHNVRNGVEVLSGDADDIGQIGDRLVEEAKSALSAAGIDVADQKAERTEDVSAFRIDKESGIKPGQQSTWQSFVRGASSETDYLNGEIVLLGRIHGVATPYNAAIQEILGAAAVGREAPGTRTAAEVLALAGELTVNDDKEVRL